MDTVHDISVVARALEGLAKRGAGEKLVVARGSHSPFANAVFEHAIDVEGGGGDGRRAFLMEQWRTEAAETHLRVVVVDDLVGAGGARRLRWRGGGVFRFDAEGWLLGLALEEAEGISDEYVTHEDLMRLCYPVLMANALLNGASFELDEVMFLEFREASLSA